MAAWSFITVLHAIAAGYALCFGALNIVAGIRGAGQPHRVIGRIWVVSMYIVILSSFAIREDDSGFFSLTGMSWLHGLSAFTALTVTLGLRAAIKRNIHHHRHMMIGSYLGLWGAFIGAVVVPDRLIPRTATGDPLAFALWAALLIASALVVARSLALAGEPRKPAAKLPE